MAGQSHLCIDAKRIFTSYANRGEVLSKICSSIRASVREAQSLKLGLRASARGPPLMAKGPVVAILYFRRHQYSIGGQRLLRQRLGLRRQCPQHHAGHASILLAFHFTQVQSRFTPTFDFSATQVVRKGSAALGQRLSVVTGSAPRRPKTLSRGSVKFAQGRLTPQRQLGLPPRLRRAALPAS